MNSKPRSPYPNEDYTVAWITSSTAETAAGTLHLDENHGWPQTNVAWGGAGVYTCGMIGPHKVVLLRSGHDFTGAINAVKLLQEMRVDFPQLRLVIHVGTAVGLPCYNGTDERDIRLGDVVIGNCKDSPENSIVSYSRMIPTLREMFNPPPQIVRDVLGRLDLATASHGNLIMAEVNKLLAKNEYYANRSGKIPDFSTDLLFRSDYAHADEYKACDKACDKANLCPARPERRNNLPVIHQGTIGTSGTLWEDAEGRDNIMRLNPDFLCLDTPLYLTDKEWPVLAIRGISNYADSHVNKKWKAYPSLTAGAVAKMILNELSVEDVLAQRRMGIY